MDRNMKQEPVVTVVGHPFAPIGMGQQVRACFRAFKAVDIDAGLLDVYRLNQRSDTGIEREVSASLVTRLSPHINVFNINGDEVDPILKHLDDPNFDRAHNIVCPAWELQDYPETWAKMLDRFDEVWAPTTFVADAVSKRVNIPVVPMQLSICPTMSSFIGRRAMGLPEYAFTFLFFFDFSSYASRKNPFAVIDAFNALVEKEPKARFHLILKCKGQSPDGKPESRFKDAVAKHADQITVIEKTMTKNETNNLVRNADCFVSLHRSEGFGLGLAEAMALGTPVVATGWSGNMDFMSADTAWLVDYDLIDINRGEYPFGEGQVWADAHVDHAVELMHAIWQDKDATRLKAAKAQRRTTCDLSPRAIGLRYLDRLETGPAAKAFAQKDKLPA